MKGDLTGKRGTAPGLSVIQFYSPGDLAQAVAKSWLQDLREAGPTYATALLGGRIARLFFAETAAVAQNTSSRALFNNVHFFWSDERCVPPSDPESNFLAAKNLLLQPLSIPEQRIHRCRGEERPEVAVTTAEQELRSVGLSEADGVPILHLIFLGLGEDGHVASLFPGAADTTSAEPSFYKAVSSPKPPPFRITMTFSVLAVARAVWVLASGPGKAAALESSLKADGQTPLARLLRLRGGAQTRIFTDVVGF